jgi:hypothetical protein
LIRIEDPSRLGQALGEIRKMLGIPRLALAREIAAATGRSIHGVECQLKAWDGGINSPTASALGPYLEALGYDLALVPRGDA